VIDVLVLSPATAASDISTTSERRLEVLGRCIPMLARGLSMHGGCVLRHVLPIKIGFWNPGLSKGGVVSGMGWSCGVLHRTSLEGSGREWSFVCSVYFVAIGAISLLSCQDWARWIMVDCGVGEAEESHPRPINVMLQNATSCDLIS
jgi:hypothetical protein